MLNFLKFRRDPRPDRNDAFRNAYSRGYARGRYDAAQTTGDNAKHWSFADFLSADAEADASVRQILRTRARYEVANNSYAKGIVLTLANDAVGTGPRLQMLTDRDDLNRRVEHDWSRWEKAVRLAEKLRTLRMARCQDGEAFVLLANNPNLGDPSVTLDLQPIEADRVTEDRFNNDPNCIDGITLDAFGNPRSYRILRYHPGGEAAFQNAARDVDARHVVHLFREDRPGQHRGVPEITPALPLFANLRRYTLAVVAAAEAAADFAGILYTDAPANGEAADVDPMDTIQLERNMLLTIPGGWKMSQLDPKQPATSYGDFKREVLNEIARCLNIPYNIAAGNSSGYNYASGRLDHQTYYKSITVERSYIERALLDRVFARWLREWSLSTGTAIDECDCKHTWFWDGAEHVDPNKEASAQATRLSSLTTTLAAEYARQGKDWEVELRQLARERDLKKELGLKSGHELQYGNQPTHESERETGDE